METKMVKNSGRNSSALTMREQEIYSLVRDGKNNDEMSLLLSISNHTVKTHLKTIFKKYGVSKIGKLVFIIKQNSLGQKIDKLKHFKLNL